MSDVIEHRHVLADVGAAHRSHWAFIPRLPDADRAQHPALSSDASKFEKASPSTVTVLHPENALCAHRASIAIAQLGAVQFNDLTDTSHLSSITWQ